MLPYRISWIIFTIDLVILYYNFLWHFLDLPYNYFGTKLCGQIVGIPMVKNCAPLISDLLSLCYERDFMISPLGDTIIHLKH